MRRSAPVRAATQDPAEIARVSHPHYHVVANATAGIVAMQELSGIRVGS